MFVETPRHWEQIFGNSCFFYILISSVKESTCLKQFLGVFMLEKLRHSWTLFSHSFWITHQLFILKHFRPSKWTILTFDFRKICLFAGVLGCTLLFYPVFTLPLNQLVVSGSNQTAKLEFVCKCVSVCAWWSVCLYNGQRAAEAGTWEAEGVLLRADKSRCEEPAVGCELFWCVVGGDEMMEVLMDLSLWSAAPGICARQSNFLSLGVAQKGRYRITTSLWVNCVVFCFPFSEF